MAPLGVIAAVGRAETSATNPVKGVPHLHLFAFVCSGISVRTGNIPCTPFQHHPETGYLDLKKRSVAKIFYSVVCGLFFLDSFQQLCILSDKLSMPGDNKR